LPIRRYEPGETALARGTYALVGHYGEPTGVAMWREAGEELPVVTAEVEYPIWFVLVGIPDEIAQAA
jgi:hypothetical protein